MSIEPVKGPSRAAKTNLVLAVTLIVVSGFAYWLEVRKKPEMRKQEELKGRLVMIDEGQELESVHLAESTKKLSLDLRCTQGCKLNNPNAKWEIVSPLQFKADEANVGTFLSGITGATVSESIPLEGDIESKLKEFGLSKDQREANRAEIKFKKDSQPYVLYFGDNAAVGENMYVYFTGPGVKSDSIRILPNYLKNNLTHGVSYWRAKKIFDFSGSEVEGLTLKNPSGTVELKHDAGHWYLMPGKQLADDEAVDTFVTGLVFMNAKDYVSDDKTADRTKFGMSPSKGHYSLTIKVAKRPDINFEVYDILLNKEPKLYAMLGDKNFIVELDRSNAEKFGKKSESFRFRNLFTAAEKEQTGTVDVQFAGKDKFQFKSDNGQWKLASGKLDGYTSASIDQAFAKVGAARIAEFLGKKPVPAGNDELSSWQLADKSGGTLREFKVYGSVAKGDYYVKLSSGELGKLERGSGSVIPSKATDLQPAQTGKK